MARGNRRPAHDGEMKEVQKLKLENQKLRRQITKLRKELTKIDVDRYQHLRDLIESQDNEDEQFDRDREADKVKEKWACHTCGHDYLRLVLIRRLDGTFYFRRCPTCMHKTKLQKYTEDVEGIRDE